MTTRNPKNITPRVEIPAGVTPNTELANFPSHYADFGQGGLHSVAVAATSTTQTSRDDIPSERRQQGMLVYVEAENKFYRLESGITNSDWVEFVTSSSTSGHTIENPVGTPLTTRTDLQFTGNVSVTDNGTDTTIVSVPNQDVINNVLGSGNTLVGPRVPTTNATTGNVSKVETSIKTIKNDGLITIGSSDNELTIGTTAEINNLPTFSSTVSYALAAQVVFGNKLYVAIAAVPAGQGNPPNNAAGWSEVNSGGGTGTITGADNIGTPELNGEAIFDGVIANRLKFKRLKEGRGIDLTSELDDILIETNGRLEIKVVNNSGVVIPRQAILNLDEEFLNTTTGTLTVPVNPTPVVTGQSNCVMTEEQIGIPATLSSGSTRFFTTDLSDNQEGIIDIVITNGLTGSPFSFSVSARAGTSTNTDPAAAIQERLNGLITNFIAQWATEQGRSQYTLTPLLGGTGQMIGVTFTAIATNSALSGTIALALDSGGALSPLSFPNSPVTITQAAASSNTGLAILYGPVQLNVSGKFTQSAPFSVENQGSIFYGLPKIPASPTEIILGERLKNVNATTDPDPVRVTFTFDGFSTATTQQASRIANLVDVDIRTPLRTGQKLVYTGSTAQLRIPFDTSVMMDEFDQVKITFPPNLRHLNIGGLHGPIYGYEIRAQALGAAFESNDRHLRLFIADDPSGTPLTITQWLNNSLNASTSGNSFDPQGLRDYNVSDTGSTDPQDNIRPNNSFGTWTVEPTSTSIDLVFTFNTTVTQADIDAISVAFTAEPTDGNRIPKSGLQTLGRTAGAALWTNEGGYGQNTIRARYLSGPDIAPFTFVGISGTPDTTGAFTIAGISNIGQDAEIYVTGAEIITASSDLDIFHTLVSSGVISEFQIPASTNPFVGAFLDTNKRLVDQGASSAGLPNDAVGKIVYSQNTSVDPQLWVFEKFNANRLGGQLTNRVFNGLKIEKDGTAGNNLGSSLASIRLNQQASSGANGNMIVSQPFAPTYIKTTFNDTLEATGNGSINFYAPSTQSDDIIDAQIFERTNPDLSLSLAPVPYLPGGVTPLTAPVYTPIAGVEIDIEIALNIQWNGNADGQLTIILDFMDGYQFQPIYSIPNITRPGNSINQVLFKFDQALLFRTQQPNLPPPAFPTIPFLGQQRIRLQYRRTNYTVGGGSITITNEPLQNAIPAPFPPPINLPGVDPGLYKGAYSVRRTF